MAISLKEQLHQALQISEAVSYPGIQYHAPPVNVLKKGMEDSHTRKQATQLFYDFYAMNLMHSLVGKPPKDPSPDMSDPVIRNAAEMGASEQDLVNMQKYKNAMGAYPEHSGAGLFVNWGDVENLPAGVSPAPTALRRVVEHVYRQVVRQITSKMMAHLRLTLVQEFRYLVTHAKDWQSFRQKLVAISNKSGGKVSKQEFEQAISEKIPGLKNHSESVVRLLKFCKYYSPMHPDPSGVVPMDITPPLVGKPVSILPQPEVEPEPEIEPEPEEPPTAQKPDPDDTTDYDMPPVEIPPGADWGDEPYDYSSELEKEKVKQWLKQKKSLNEGLHDPGYAAGRISPHTILAVKQAIKKSGLTWDDIIVAYKNLNWGGAYGGPKWGIGAEAFVKLVAQAKSNNIEDMAGLIDHIYDLEHNTGDLLNKGGMYVASSDLDRRAKVTSLARYIGSVSPIVHRLILRVLKYTSNHPEIDADVQKITQSPTQPFSKEEAERLGASKFAKSSAGDEWTTQAPYKNKKDETVQNQYTAKHHTNGMYSIQDTINADIQVFDEWKELESWITQNENGFIAPTPGHFSYEPLQSMSEKDQFLAGKTKIKLDAEKETKLLEECKMAWRPSNHYYKAYLPGDDRFQFFAFSDGTFMGCVKSTKKVGAILNDWHTAFIYCQGQTANALPNNEYEEGKAWIGKPIDATPPKATPSVPSVPKVGTTVGTEYTLSPVEIQMLQILATNVGGIKVLPNIMPEGITAFEIQIDPGGGNLTQFNVLTVGKKAISPTGKKYVVKHAVYGKEVEEWSFANWNQTYNFLTKNLELLIQAQNPVKGTVSAAVTPQIFPSATSTAQLPPHSTSKAAYKVHVGIQKPPSHTIRLTEEHENSLKAVGFEPKMVGSDVWYIHTAIGDTVKFFPNDIAKIMFIKTNNKAIITKKIEDALAWLMNHYYSGATQSPIVAPSTEPNKGSKAGAMYEKIIADAGFEWEPNNGIYVNKDNPDTIIISPFPQSTVTTPEGKKKFSSLPQLAVFLKGYNGLKKKY